MLTTRGTLLLLLAAPVLVAATWLPIFRWIAIGYILLCLILLGLDWLTAGKIGSFEITRQHDDKLSLGGNNLVTVSLRNREARPVTFWLRDEPPDAFVLSERVLSGRVDKQHTWQQTYHIKPLRRGNYQFGNLNLRWLGRLSLVIRQGQIDAANSVKVYPNLLDVNRYDLLLKRNRLQEIGLRHTRLIGRGTEFERLREYTPDDEYRHINWKATARRRRPISAQYQTERSQNILAVLDVGRTMQSPIDQIAKLDYVINAVLLLGYVATGMGDKVGLMTFADEVRHFLPPRQGRGQFYRMLETLYAIEAQSVEPNYRQALSYVSLKQRKRALVIIFTDLSGSTSTQDLVSHATSLAKRSLPLVVTINDPDVHGTAYQKPQDSLGVYQQTAAIQLRDERQVTLDHLRRRGVLTLDVPANHLSIAVINHYLELKARNRI